MSKQIAQTLMNILPYAQKGIGKIGTAAKSASVGSMKLPGISTTPQSILTSLISLLSKQKISGVPEIQEPGSSVRQKTVRLPALGLPAAIGQIAGQNRTSEIIADTTEKTVKKKIAKQVEEGIDAGVPAEKYLDVINNTRMMDKFNAIPDANKLNQTISGATEPAEGQVQPQIQPEQKPFEPQKVFSGPGEALLFALGEISGVPNQATYNVKQRMAEIERQSPMTEAKKQELEATGMIDLQKELVKKGTPDALSPEKAAKFSLLLDGQKAVGEAAQILFEDPSSFKSRIQEYKLSPTFIKSQAGLKLKTAIERMYMAKLRLESGAAISPKEAKQEARKWVASVFATPKTAQDQLRPLFEFYESAINMADPTGTYRRQAKGGTQKSEGVVMQDASGNKALVDPITKKVIKEL